MLASKRGMIRSSIVDLAEYPALLEAVKDRISGPAIFLGKLSAEDAERVKRLISRHKVPFVLRCAEVLGSRVCWLEQRGHVHVLKLRPFFAEIFGSALSFRDAEVLYSIADRLEEVAERLREYADKWKSEF